ncbi:GNAT family N-acetyltransferase (plasmid) [Erythrobacteraceae bacterium WH01K]|nr:GNAT family N-acetyltransferase [Erythrobacteraceae bacterium WH01K]
MKTVIPELTPLLREGFVRKCSNPKSNLEGVGLLSVRDISLTERPDLLTERLVLRRPELGDVEAIVSIVGDWDVARRLARVPYPYGTDDAHFFLDEVVPSEWVWAITLIGDDTLIGAVGLTPEEDRNSAELGYWLSPAHAGKGIATEAATEVVRFGFESLRLPLVTSGYFEDNPASGRVLRKLGFIETGPGERSSMAAGSTVPSVEMELPRSNWLE